MVGYAGLSRPTILISTRAESANRSDSAKLDLLLTIDHKTVADAGIYRSDQQIGS